MARRPPGSRAAPVPRPPVLGRLRGASDRVRVLAGSAEPAARPPALLPPRRPLADRAPVALSGVRSRAAAAGRRGPGTPTAVGRMWSTSSGRWIWMPHMTTMSMSRCASRASSSAHISVSTARAASRVRSSRSSGQPIRVRGDDRAQPLRLAVVQARRQRFGGAAERVEQRDHRAAGGGDPVLVAAEALADVALGVDADVGEAEHDQVAAAVVGDVRQRGAPTGATQRRNRAESTQVERLVPPAGHGVQQRLGELVAADRHRGEGVLAVEPQWQRRLVRPGPGSARR